MVVAGLLVVSAAIGAALGYQLQASSSSAAASPIDAPRSERPQPQQSPPRAVGEAASPIDVPRSQDRGAAPATAPGSPPAESPRARGPAPPDVPDRVHQPPGRPPAPPAPGAAAPGGAAPRDRSQRGATGEANGIVPDGTTVFDDEIPGVARLNPTLLGALRQAATAATRDGIELYVTSGWRSPAYQEQLLREAISQYGSAKEAARWVGTPTASAHVSGDAVDIGPSDATAWLSKHGVTYGLCQIYRNEPWHYELRPDAVGRGCPPMYADPTHDPRMRP
jgi:D-alanyl-D-alanine carboxypeptidase